MKLKSYVLAAATLTMIAAPLTVRADDTTPAAQPAPAAPAAATGAAQAAPAAAPMPQVPAALQKWAKFCDPAPDGHKICIVRKIVFSNNNIIGTFVLRIDTAKGVPVLAVAAAPVGVVLKPGLNWQIDTTKAAAFPYWRCTPQMCESERLVDPAFIASLKKGKQLTLTAKNVEGKDFVIPVPLAGFGTAYDQQDAPTFAEFNKSLPKQAPQ